VRKGGTEENSGQVNGICHNANKDTMNKKQIPVSLALEEMGIPHSIFVHESPPKTLEQAAHERGQQPEQIIRSILFRIPEGNYVMVLMAGPRQIDWKKLRKAVGKSRITMASADEVQRITGYKLGAVAPFGLPGELRILVDKSVTNEKVVSMGSGEVGTAVIVTSDDLIKALGEVEVGSYGVSPSTAV